MATPVASRKCELSVMRRARPVRPGRVGRRGPRRALRADLPGLAGHPRPR